MKTLIKLITLTLASLAVLAAPTHGQSLSVLHSFDTGPANPTAPLLPGPDGALYGTTVSGGSDSKGEVFKIQPDGTGFASLYSFTGGADGANPPAGLILSGDTLYGATEYGGSSGNGTIFSLTTKGSNFTALYSFSATYPNSAGASTNCDGVNPVAGLVLSGDTLYGAAEYGGGSGNGTIFSLNTNGTGFENLHTFTGGSDGIYPNGSLILSNNILYGTTDNGGISGNGPAYGTVFSVRLDGTGFKSVHSFIFTDGIYPNGNLILSDNTLYGTTDWNGGSGDGTAAGTLFRVNTDGVDFTNLHSFNSSDGEFPNGSLVLSGNVLYGTASQGGISGSGSVFSLNIDGTSFTNLHSFSGGSNGANPFAGLTLAGDTLYGTASDRYGSGSGAVFTLDTSGSSYAVLYRFSYGNDGANPYAGLVSSGNLLYGTTQNGGTANEGMVFAVGIGGAGFTNLHSFTGSDGENPQVGLILSGGILYGTTESGGRAGNGTVFSINTNGSGFTPLYSFSALYTNNDGTTTNTDGDGPNALILSGDMLYGTAEYGGASGLGAVFAINTNGSGFTNLYSFMGGDDNDEGFVTNSDGAYPYAGLTLSDGALYGTTAWGGSSGFGTVFAISTAGLGFTNLHSFTYDSDGANPQAGLIVSDKTLYGTTFGVDGWFVGPPDLGAVFRLNTDGTGFTNLYIFDDLIFGGAPWGAFPSGALVLSGDTLYGTAEDGGGSGSGTVFSLSANGSDFTTLYSFSGTSGSYPYSDSDGANPYAGLIVSGNMLYGTAEAGGGMGQGVVFALSLPALLKIQPVGGNVVLTWSNPASSLQAAPTVSGVYTNVPGATSPYASPATGPQTFFRLQSN